MTIKDNNLYFIGGVVRDEFLGTASFDVDYCYEGDAIKFAENQNFNIIKSNCDLGTVRINYNDNEIDIASTRMERYPLPGHLPVIDKIACSLEEDLKRRDFTINALAKNTITDEIIDYYNGVQDIADKKLRILHEKSFIDDPSRIIRGLKFAVRFNFDLEEHTFELQNEYLNNINYDMSYHRIKKEIIETFNLNKFRAYELFLTQNIYKLLGPNEPVFYLKKDVEELIEKYSAKYSWVIYMAGFVLDNLSLNADEKAIIDSYIRINDIKPKNSIDAYKLFVKEPLESIILYALTVDKEVALNYLDNLSNIKLNITGEDLIMLNIPQGKIYKDIIDYVLAYKINNPNITKDDELDLVKKRFL